MKVFYLRLVQDDFTKSDNVWTSNIIDLYDNESYKNYSTTKSPYGLNLLGNNTWVGLNQYSSTVTDSGVVSDGRFIDTTGRIDVESYTASWDNLPGVGIINTTLDFYTIDEEAATFPEEWAVVSGIPEARPVIMVNSYRYAKIVLHLDTSMPTDDLELDFLVRIKIDPPVMAPLYDRTRVVLDKFPEWMSMREIDSESATPESVGGQLINAVAGEWLSDFDANLDHIRAQMFIDTTDLDQMSWIHYSANIPEKVYSITGDGVELARTASLEEFSNTTEDEDVCYWDEVRRTVYCRKDYDSLEVNGTEYLLTALHVWNWFDEFGLSVDLPRHFLESNESYRARIKDVYQNPPGVSLDRLKLTLRRELNLWTAFGATPDSDYQGATPEILEISDIENDVDGATPYMGYDNVPTDKFFHLADELAVKYPTTWGFFKWGKAFWDVGGTENKGYGALAYRYDAEALSDVDVQSGIGDGNDLYVYAPDELTGAQTFDVRLKVRGQSKTTRDEYRKVDFEVKLWGRADKKIYANPVTTEWLTVKVVDTGATPTTYYHSFQMSAASDIKPENATNTAASYAQYRIWGEDGLAEDGTIWVDADGNEYDTAAVTPWQLHQNDIESIELRFGKWDPDTDTYTDVPVDLNSKAWWSIDSGTKLNSNAGTVLVGTTPGAAYVVFESLQVSYAIGKWESETQNVSVSLNGALPSQTEQSVTIDAPVVIWDDYLEATPNKEYVVEIVTLDDELNPGGYSTDADGALLFIAASDIDLNGSTTWVDGIQYLDADITTELEFSTDEAITNYPVEVSVWTLFEADAETNISGVVDENGPWRNGEPSVPGNTNYNLTQVEVDRDDFNIPNSEDYSLTWMGVEVVDNGNVVAWLDSNTINPAVSNSTLTYPDNAIVETYDENSELYSFSPFIIRARLRPGINPAWNPKIHSGWFYDRNDEYYLYADPESATITTATPILPSVSRQGAPIIAWTNEASPQREFRQVAFVDSATPTVLTLTNTEEVTGSGTSALYLAYEDVYEVTVTNTDTGEAVEAASYTPSHVLPTEYVTDRDVVYEVTYKVNRSFYADNEYVHTDRSQRTKLVFDKHPTDLGVASYHVVYENSIYDPATPVDLPLNTMYTVQDEGFIYIDHNEYDLDNIYLRMSPSKIIADGQDFILVTIRTVDINGNPKPYQTIQLDTTWGLLSVPASFPDVLFYPGPESFPDIWNLRTDEDGFGVVILTAQSETDALTGTLTATKGEIVSTISFDIEPVVPRSYRLLAVPSADRVPADGASKVYVYGAVEDDDYQPVPYARVSWRKARSIYELFTDDYEGQLVADSSGRFTIGPFTSATPGETGYWFVAPESWSASATPYEIATPDYSDSATPTYGPVGDVIFWHEYPDVNFGVEDMTGLPKQPVQMASAPGTNPAYAPVNAFPVNYDDATPYDSATPVTIEWEPPAWYAIPRYIQYQMGILGTSFYSIDFDALQDAHPDYRDV